MLKIDQKAEITAIKQLNVLTLWTKAQRERKNWFNYSANEEVRLGPVGSKPLQSNLNISCAMLMCLKIFSAILTDVNNLPLDQRATSHLFHSNLDFVSRQMS